MKKFLRSVFLPIGVLVGMLAYLIHGEIEYAKILNPPKGRVNLVEFLNRRPQLHRISKFTHQGKTYVSVIGATTSPSILTSGPPMYIFDETGALVDWCRDIGESSTFYDKWRRENKVPINAEEAKNLVKAPGR